MTTNNKLLICILGPTAVGKTACAIRLARHFNTEIISADSRQFYHELSIGTAKPSPEELSEIRHHFIGNISINQKYSAGDFERGALPIIDKLLEKNNKLVLVGGSGLYVKALLEGLDKLPQGDEALRTALHDLLEQEGIEALQKRLMRLNPEAPAHMDMQNTQRVMRAIEIAEQGEGVGKNKTKKNRDFTALKIVLNLDRQELYERINNRVDSMISKGLVEEARAMHPYKDLYALQTVGYTELFDHFEGKTTLGQAVALIKQHTRNYAKRQLTWFKKDTDAHWCHPLDDQKMIDWIEQN